MASSSDFVSVLPSSPTSGGILLNNPIARGFRDVYQSFSDRREKLGLSNPGTVESIAKEVQREVFLTNYMHTGLRADLTKPFSMSPFFQVSHQFAMGERMQPYAFAAMFGTNKVSLIAHTRIHLHRRAAHGKRLT